MDGNSTVGSVATDSILKPRSPTNTTATTKHVVAMGRAINGAEMFIEPGSRPVIEPTAACDCDNAHSA
jgi:hypothetical protein